MVEGKNDYYSLRYMMDLILPVSPSPIHIYPGAGKDKLDTIVGLYTAWGREFLVILDDDNGGRRTADRLKKDFGPVIDQRVSTLRDVASEWKGFSMEDLFTVPDKKKIMAIAYPGQTKYDKGKFNVALQECLITGRALSLQQVTVRRFDKLMRFVTARLPS
jgi:hypothetical protein